MPPIDQVKEISAKEKIEFVYLQFSDLLGQVKNVVVEINKFWDGLDSGFWFDGSSVEGFARISESDMCLKPDLSTFAVIPWSEQERRSARVICNIFSPDGKAVDTDPRNILQKTVRKAKKLGYDYKSAAEFEFYLFERELLPELVPHDRKSYFDYTPHSRAAAICEQTMLSLKNFGIEGEIHHHEVGNGQHEIDIKYDDAVRSADNICTIKTALKAHTSNTELKATWMPKPIFGSAGDGMHVHQSLWRGDENAFHDNKSEYGLSKIALSFLAGQLAHARALSAIVSPTVNSYKRLVPGYEAPVYICWGRNNRSALIRIPQNIASKSSRSSRMEYRAPDPSANPYLVFASLLTAGLDGMQKKLVPPPSIEENVYHFDINELHKNHINLLPTSLDDAIDALEQDPVILGIFGKFKDRYLEIKRQEWKEYSMQVTPWEHKKYL